MKTIKTKIRNDCVRDDYVLVKKDAVVFMDDNITTILNWMEKLNDKENSPVTEEAYSAIDHLSSFLEHCRRL